MKVILSFISNTLFNFIIGLLLAKFLGPDDYGRFALALAVAVMVQTIAFDWARLAASRFYSERMRVEEPKLRATLDTALAALILLLALGTLILLLVPVSFSLSPGLIALACATAAANGLFDYHTALVRARFLDGLYARLIIGKNVLSMILTVGGAFWFGSATMALLGICLSMSGALLGVRRGLADPGTAPRLADPALAGTLFRYALPIVLANLLYQTIPLVDRVLIARMNGFAESGQFSFAYDIGIRIVAAIGSTLDVLLFQIAVRADEIHGTEQAKRQVGHNIGIVVAVLSPASLGCWLVLPSFARLVVPNEFQASFVLYLTLLLPGLFCFGLIFFAMHPLFQIGKRTVPLVAVAAFASVTNLVCIATLPASADASHYAIAQGIALAVGLVALVVWAALSRPVWPRPRDLVGTLLACGLMAAVVHPLNGLQPGLITLLAQIGLGASVYAAIALAVDLCGCRMLLTNVLRRLTSVTQNQP